MNRITAEETFKSKATDLQGLLGDTEIYLYIPAYQRPYEWDAPQVKEFLIDICDGIRNLHSNNKAFTFLGSVILVKDSNFESVHPLKKDDMPQIVNLVIDGQQRMTTLQMLCLILHNKLGQYKKAFTDQEDTRILTKASDTWLANLAENTLEGLTKTLYSKRGEYQGVIPKYPRIIRASFDNYARNTAEQKYASPLARVVYEYISNENQSNAFVPSPNDADPHFDPLLKRFSQIEDILQNLIKGQGLDDDAILNFSDSIHSKVLIESLDFNIDKTTRESLSRISLDDSLFIDLFRILVIANFVLKRIVLTRIVCDDENYAFSVFESLNSTGATLTAFETFTPRVVRSFGLSSYENSATQRQMHTIQEFLAADSTKDRETRTGRLITTFALAETGEKLSSHLSDQRRFMDDAINMCEGNSDSVRELVRNLAVTCEMRRAFTTAKAPSCSTISVHDQSQLDLAFAFFSKHNHQMPLGLLSRFFSSTLLEDIEEETLAKYQNDFLSAAKACLAFTVLWRATRVSTKGIDSKYREIMLDRTVDGQALKGIARKFANDLDVQSLKTEFKRFLSMGHGPIRNGIVQNGREKVFSKESFISSARNMNVYSENKALAKLLLLAAHNRTTHENQDLTRLRKGRNGCVEYLNIDKWNDPAFETIEHICPQSKPQSSDWDSAVYTNSLVDRIGNLTLLSKELNSSFGNKTWKEKKVLYQALSKQTKEDAQEIFDEAANDGIVFGISTEELMVNWSYTPIVEHIAAREEFKEHAVLARTDMLLGLAWDELWPWLN